MDAAKKVSEFGEVYGEVLLGLHRRVAELDKRVGGRLAAIETELKAMQGRQRDLEKRMDAFDAALPLLAKFQQDATALTAMRETVRHLHAEVSDKAKGIRDEQAQQARTLRRFRAACILVALLSILAATAVTLWILK